MPFELLTPAIVALAVFAVAYFARARSSASADGPSTSQIGLVPERWADPLRPLGRRRLLAIAWVGLLVGALISMWINSAYAPFVAIASWWVGIVISHSTRAMAERSASELDERMVAARNRAFRTAYYLLGGAAAVLLFITGNFGDAIWNSPAVTFDTGALTGAALLTIIVVMHLPSVILAWTEEII